MRALERVILELGLLLLGHAFLSANHRPGVARQNGPAPVICAMLFLFFFLPEQHFITIINKNVAPVKKQKKAEISFQKEKDQKKITIMTPERM